MMTKQLFTRQENHCTLTISKWIKRDSGLFDATMRAYDGAEVCESVENYLLYELSELYEKKDIRLYIDDGLAVFKNKSRPESERIKKSIQAVYSGRTS